MKFTIRKNKSKSFLDYLYTIALALSLCLHIFNMGGGEVLKPFHFAAALACILTFYFARRNKQIDVLVIFLISVLFSAILSPVDTAFSGMINVFIVSLCCYGVAIVEIEKLLAIMLFLIPIDLLVLLVEAIQNPIYRFQGFYNDPNYLCTTLIVFFYICILSLLRFKNKLYRIIIIANLLVIVFLILLTLSRTGIACIFLLSLTTIVAVFRKHFLKVALIAIVSLIVIQYYASGFVDNEYALLYERLYENNDNLESARGLRSELSEQNIRYLIDNPIYCLWGLGPGATDGNAAKQISGLSQYRKSNSRDHNTWTSCLFEYGFFALIAFCILEWYSLISALKIKNGIQKYASCAFWAVLLIFSLSIWQMTYLPFWWGLFLINNKGLIDYK